MRLARKVALVTGAASGLGRASAFRFASEGAEVAAVDLAAPKAPPGGLGLAADVTDEASIEAAVAATIHRFGRVDVVYANAGVPSAGQVHETSLAEWRRVLDVNLTGVFLTARAVLGRRLPGRRRGDRCLPVERLRTIAVARGSRRCSCGPSRC